MLSHCPKQHAMMKEGGHCGKTPHVLEDDVLATSFFFGFYPRIKR
jgi:hypothetical protein